jgi:serine/threonine-protein kinase
LNYATVAAQSEEGRRAAVEMFSKALELDPEFALAYAGLATAHSDVYWFHEDRTRARLRQSKEAADRALELQPGLPQGHRALGRYYYHGLRDYETALEELSIARQGMPNDSETLISIGYIYRRQGRWDEAASLISRASDLNPRSAQYGLEASYTYRVMRDAENAFRYVDRAIAFYPDVAQLQMWRAKLILGMHGDPDTYRQETRRIIDRFGLLPPLPALIGSSADYILQLDEEYLRDFEQIPVAALGEVNRDVLHLYKSYVCKGTGRLEAALAHFDSARVILEPLVERTPEEANFHWRLGLVYAGLGRKEEAIREGQRARDILPVTEDAFEGARIEAALAMIYLYVGEHEAALDLLEGIQSRPAGYTVNYLRLSEFADSLGSNPRFQRLIAEPTPSS